MTGPVVAFGISLAIVLIAMIYIVLEWCLQSVRNFSVVYNPQDVVLILPNHSI